MKHVFSLFKKLVLYPTIFLLSLAPLSPAFAQQDFISQNKACVGSTLYKVTDLNTGKPDPKGASDVPTIQGLECLVANILATAITLVGIVAFVMFLIGGFRYLTAGANAKGTETAKNSITFAVLGIIVALASFLILNVIAQITGVKTILKFSTQVENIK